MKHLRLSLLAGVCVFLVASFADTAGASPSTAKTFEVEKGGDLVVDIENIGADIRVSTWKKLEVAVRVEGISEDDLEWLEIGKEGNTVSVYFDAGNGWRRHRHARFYVSVPNEFNLDVGTSGGDVAVEGDIEGDVTAATAGGDIGVDDVAGRVELRTAGGDVRAGDIDGDAKLKSSGGDIELGNVTGDLVAGTAGGDIEVGDVGEDLRAETAGGDIVCSDVGGEAVAQTAGGDIELGVVEKGVTARTAGGDIEIRGATGEVEAKTAGGDVELAAVKGHVDAETAGGDVIVELDPTNEAGSSLESNGGNIELHIPADAKVTVEARIRLRYRGGDWGDDYDIRSDFEAETHEKSDKEVRARYVINGGGKVVNMKTTNGHIEIRKR